MGEIRKDGRKLKVPGNRSKPAPKEGEILANGGIVLSRRGVGVEPLNSTPGAEEGSLHQVQGSDAVENAGSHLNPT